MHSPGSQDRLLSLQSVASELIPPLLLAVRTVVAETVFDAEVGRVLMKLIELLVEASNWTTAPTHFGQTTGRYTLRLRSSSSLSARMRFYSLCLSYFVLKLRIGLDMCNQDLNLLPPVTTVDVSVQLLLSRLSMYPLTGLILE